jgi:hypothetical protein
MTVKQYGVWDEGRVSPGKMLNKLLRSMRDTGASIPIDNYGSMSFRCNYIYRPPVDRNSPDYMPGRLNDTGFTAIKVNYDEG